MCHRGIAELNICRDQSTLACGSPYSLNASRAHHILDEYSHAAKLQIIVLRHLQNLLIILQDTRLFNDLSGLFVAFQCFAIFGYGLFRDVGALSVPISLWGGGLASPAASLFPWSPRAKHEGAGPRAPFCVCPHLLMKASFQRRRAHTQKRCTFVQRPLCFA